MTSDLDMPPMGFETILTILHFAIGFAGLVYAIVVAKGLNLRSLLIVTGSFGAGLLIVFIVYVIVVIQNVEATRQIELRIMQAVAGNSLTAEDIFARIDREYPLTTTITPKMKFDALMNLVTERKLQTNVASWQTANGISHSTTVYMQ